MNVIKQTTYESCLSCCLIMVADGIIKDEIDIWKSGWSFNYLIGQLNFVSNKYNKKIKAYIENEYYFNDLKSQKSKNIELINKKVDIELLFELLKKNKVILYLDCYYLQGILHAPHFVVAIRKVEDSIEIADPADGKIKVISVKIIEDSIESLRNYLKYSPVLVVVS